MRQSHYLQQKRQTCDSVACFNIMIAPRGVIFLCKWENLSITSKESRRGATPSYFCPCESRISQIPGHSVDGPLFELKGWARGRLHGEDVSLFMLQLCLKCSCPDNRRQKRSCSYLLLLTAASPHQLSSRATQTGGDGAGGSLRQRHHLLQRYCWLHVHVCREHTSTGTWLCLNVSFIGVGFFFFRILKIFVGGCWNLTLLFYSYMKGAQVPASPASHSSPGLCSHTRAEIVQPLDGRVHWRSAESLCSVKLLPLAQLLQVAFDPFSRLDG